jgi:hypothetical protein
MRSIAFIALLLALTCRAQSDIYFLPCAAKATVSFEGVTQAARDVHRLEVRRLAYISSPAKKESPTQISCVIYFAGAEYGPSILRQIDDCIDPLVRKASKDIIEIYFTTERTRTFASAGGYSVTLRRWRKKKRSVGATTLDDKPAEQGARANAHVCHESC